MLTRIKQWLCSHRYDLADLSERDAQGKCGHCGMTVRLRWTHERDDTRCADLAHIAHVSGVPGCPESGKHCRVVDGECQTCGATGVDTSQKPDSARLPSWDGNGMVRALVLLSRALGHKPGSTVDASEGQCVEAALIELAAKRLAASGVSLPLNDQPKEPK